MSGGFYCSAMTLECSNGTMRGQMFEAVGEFRPNGFGGHEVMGISRQRKFQSDASSDSVDYDIQSRAIQGLWPTRTQTRDVDLDAQVESVKVYKRPLDSASGGSSLFSSGFGPGHQAAVAKTTSGELYLIEKGVESDKAIGTSRECYRKGECRLVKIKKSDMYGWELIRELKASMFSWFSFGVTLRQLFDICGSKYRLLSDNCIHGVDKICAFLQLNGFISS
ncbi:hypothetical protein BOX15_Mlig012613g2 [Macrostomum lignano]|uniref:Protein kinase domain-containing protein n=2 Tax=Macrostomum lignano TaxID=282301 RepID=A0A1I8HNZ7_9PLAT|nr:hypothetical protein BOX15_Mlig012613g1 [Macrostomum lignano]PAA88431.1 hypothetical protein BOX15_Mlig012613g2 [Macrostomum lignano]